MVFDLAACFSQVVSEDEHSAQPKQPVELIDPVFGQWLHFFITLDQPVAVSAPFFLRPERGGRERADQVVKKPVITTVVEVEGDQVCSVVVEIDTTEIAVNEAEVF